MYRPLIIGPRLINEASFNSDLESNQPLTHSAVSRSMTIANSCLLLIMFLLWINISRAFFHTLSRDSSPLEVSRRRKIGRQEEEERREGD
jgi:hypothetical protein